VVAPRAGLVDQQPHDAARVRAQRQAQLDARRGLVEDGGGEDGAGRVELDRRRRDRVAGARRLAAVALAKRGVLAFLFIVLFVCWKVG
jgi:hypothetical protein